VNGMSNKLKVMWQGAVVVSCRITSSHMPGGTEEIGGKSVGICIEIILSHEQKPEVFTVWTTVLGGSNIHGRISHVPYYVGKILVLLKKYSWCLLVFSCVHYRDRSQNCANQRRFIPVFLILYIISFLGVSLVIYEISFIVSRLV